MEEFWHRSREEEWYPTHPDRDRFESSPKECLPGRIFGDDVRVNKVSLAMVVSWCTVMSRLPTFLSRFLFTVIDLTMAIGEATFDAIWEVLNWSFDVLAGGEFPWTDHNGDECLCPVTLARRGKPIGGNRASHLRLYFTQYLGDWKWIKEQFLLKASYANKRICHLCFVEKAPGRIFFATSRQVRRIRDAAGRMNNSCWIVGGPN